jgi:hypothetical protein
VYELFNEKQTSRRSTGLGTAAIEAPMSAIDQKRTSVHS